MFIKRETKVTESIHCAELARASLLDEGQDLQVRTSLRTEERQQSDGNQVVTRSCVESKGWECDLSLSAVVPSRCIRNPGT